jgi:hypothetical protein
MQTSYNDGPLRFNNAAACRVNRFLNVCSLFGRASPRIRRHLIANRKNN